MKLTNQFSIQAKDFAKGALQAVGAVVVPLLLVYTELGRLPTSKEWLVIAAAGSGAFITYVGRKFLVNTVPAAQETIAKAEQKVIAKQYENNG